MCLSGVSLAVTYYKIARVLYNQSEIFKIPQDQNAVTSSFGKQRYRRNRKAFFVCIMTVVFYFTGNIAVAVGIYVQATRNHSIPLLNEIILMLKMLTTQAVNPLIYGLLDKKLLIFWKNCQKKKANVVLKAPVE